MEKVKSYSMGSTSKEWKGGMAQTLTFIVTEDCNLRCKYCYISHKSPGKSMDFEVAKKFIDYIFSDNLVRPNAVILDFIGGEPLIEVDLIDKICDYFKIKSYELNDSWWWNYRISMSTNGINYDSNEVQKFISKNIGKIYISITLDGTKEKHDLQRVFPDGKGSYEIVKKNMDLLLTQFSGMTKVTFASDDLPMLKESIVELWTNGVTDIAANVVFEDVWKEGDDKVFEEQLILLADHVLDNSLYDKYLCTLFDDYIGEPYSKHNFNQTSCGAGKMLAVDGYGKIFPCMRYKGYSLNKKEEWTVGDVDNGIDFERIRPFIGATITLQSDDECLQCKVATGCSFCQGLNYDEADTPTNYQRVKHICKMHKARVRANNYYFAKLYNQYGVERKNYNNEQYKLNFLLSNNYVQFCSEAKSNSDTNIIMDMNVIIDGLRYAYENYLTPVFVHDKNALNIQWNDFYNGFRILHIIPAKLASQVTDRMRNVLYVFDTSDDLTDLPEISNCIFNIEAYEIENLSEHIIKLLKKIGRVNVNILNYNKLDYMIYSEELKKITDYIFSHLREYNEMKEVNIITDDLYNDRHENCGAGEKHYTLSPEGQLFICPNDYSKGGLMEIGDLVKGITNHKNSNLFTMGYASLCIGCDINHCCFCVDHNRRTTGEVNVTSSFQCIKSHVEYEATSYLKALIINDGIDLVTFEHNMNSIESNKNKSMDNIHYVIQKNGLDASGIRKGGF